MNHEETIFEQALGISTPQGRGEFLRGACADNEAMFARLEGLLRAHDRAGKFLEHERPAGGESSPPLAATAATPTISLPLTEKPGDRIGRYKLLQKIGEGGCGVVYMAEQAEPVRRRVALKIIKLGMDTRQVIARFEAERQALALMDHPNIAKVFDAGATDSPHPQPLSHPMGEGGRRPGDGLPAGRPYFVMELVRGVKITEYCDEKKLTTHQRLELFTQVCRAIQHAHQKGIIHRDLKPSNILVSLNDGMAVPKVIDFGIAKATTGEPLTDKTVFTAFEQFIGTPAYMSPEQALVTSLDIDTRTDIYALGVLLYELLTGHTPFDPKELLQAGLEAMRRTICEREPARPSTRVTDLVAADVRKLTTLSEEDRASSRRLLQEKERLVSQLRGDLDWIVMKCLEKDRARRYETANGLATDIQRHLNNEPVVARPPSNLYKFQKLVRRNKLAFASGVGITATLLIGLAVALWQFVEKTHAYEEQARLRQEAQKQAAKSRQVAKYLKDVIQDLGPSVATVHEPAMVREILDRAAERIDRDLVNQPETAIELRETLAAIYWELGFFDKMAGLARDNLELARATFGEENRAVANALCQLGEAEFWRDKLDEAETFHRQALGIRRKLLGNEHVDVAKSLLLLGNVFHELRNHVDAQTAYREGLTICGSLPVSDEKGLVEADLLQDLALELPRQAEESEAVSGRALEMKRKLLGNAHSSLAEALEIVALVLREEGKLAEAEVRGQEALAMYLKLFGKDHHLVGRALAGLGSTISQQGRLAEAESLLHDAIATHRRASTNEGIYLAYALHDLGWALEREGKLAQAVDSYRESMAIRKKLPSRKYFPINLAKVLRKQGKFSEARSVLREDLLALREEADTGRTDRQNQIAWMFATWPDSELRDGRTALIYAGKAVTATSRTNAMYLDTLAAAYAEAGDFAKAVGAQKEAIALLSADAEKKDFGARLQLYESNTSYREPE